MPQLIVMLFIRLFLQKQQEEQAKAAAEKQARDELLAQKFIAMEKLEREAQRDLAAFRRRTWRKLVFAHLGSDWFTMGFLALLIWAIWALRFSGLPNYWWRVGLLHLALLVPLWLIASGRTRLQPAAPSDSFWGKLLNHFRLGEASWLTLGLVAGIYPLQVFLHRLVIRGTGQPAGDPWPIDPLASTVLLALAVEVARIFPRHEALTDRVLEVTPARCPRVHQLVQEASAATGLPMPKRIFVAHESSMADIDVYRNQRDLVQGRISELRIGLRHLLLLSHDELRTVVIHELRHQQQQGNALRSALLTILPRLREQGPLKAAAALELELRLCVLMRVHERESDHASAASDGPATARALARSHAYSIVFHQFWDNLDAFVLRHPKAPGGPRQIELARAAEPDFAEKLRRAYAEALLYVTLPGASHPELMDRLQAIGQAAPADVAAPSGAPASELLDAEGRAFLQRQEQEWVSRNREAWDKRWADESARSQLCATPAESYPTLTPEQLKALSLALWSHRSPAEALPAFEARHAADPQDKVAEYWLLAARLEAGHPGADLAMLAFARGHLRSRSGLTRVAIAWKLQGRDGEARALWREYLLAGDILKQDQAERDTLPSTVPILEHVLPSEDMEKLKGVCVDYGVIQQAHLCRRRLQFIPTPEEHIIVLGFGHGSDGRYRSDFEKHQEAAIGAIKAAWGGSEGQLWVLKADQFKDLSQRVRALPGSKLHG